MDVEETRINTHEMYMQQVKIYFKENIFYYFLYIYIH